MNGQQTERLDARPAQGSATRQASVARAAALLREGALVAFPTDTVYGLGAALDQPQAVRQLYRAKGRPSEKAIPILLADARDLPLVTKVVPDWVQPLIARFWPGGLTLILRKGTNVPSAVSALPTVAVRLPDLSLTRQIIAAVGMPLAVTSANRSGQPSPRTATEVMAQLAGRIAALVDGGSCPGGVPSTILDCTADPPRVLRVGAIPVAALQALTPLA